MKCPSCQNEQTRVADSRITDGGSAIRRRRLCESCEFRFTTFERAQTSDLMVEKRDGTVEPYQREKLEKAIMLSCAKRPIDVADLRAKLTDLEETQWSKSKAVKAEQIGDDVMGLLKEIDEVAYIRFASVYKRFTDMETFQNELQKFFDSSKS